MLLTLTSLQVVEQFIKQGRTVVVIHPLLLLELINVKPNFLLNSFYTTIKASDFIVIVPASELKRHHTDGLVKLVGDKSVAIKNLCSGIPFETKLVLVHFG